MPIKIKAFACEFRCGRIATKPQTLYFHEKTCFKNPERKACKTCKHNCCDPYESDTGDGGYFYCAIDKLPTGKKMAVECKYWLSSK